MTTIKGEQFKFAGFSVRYDILKKINIISAVFNDAVHKEDITLSLDELHDLTRENPHSLKAQVIVEDIGIENARKIKGDHLSFSLSYNMGTVSALHEYKAEEFPAPQVRVF